MVQVKGDTAHLLSVSERTRYLFGKDEAQAPSGRRKKSSPQLSMFPEAEHAEEETGWGDNSAPRPGVTTLDPLMQASDKIDTQVAVLCKRELLARLNLEAGNGAARPGWGIEPR